MEPNERTKPPPWNDLTEALPEEEETVKDDDDDMDFNDDSFADKKKKKKKKKVNVDDLDDGDADKVCIEWSALISILDSIQDIKE